MIVSYIVITAKKEGEEDGTKSEAAEGGAEEGEDDDVPSQPKTVSQIY